MCRSLVLLVFAVLRQTPCPARYYNNKYGARSSSDCALCVAGGYCAQGSTNPTVCPQGYYCVTGVSSGEKCVYVQSATHAHSSIPSHGCES